MAALNVLKGCLFRLFVQRHLENYATLRFVEADFAAHQIKDPGGVTVLDQYGDNVILRSRTKFAKGEQIFRASRFDENAENVFVIMQFITSSWAAPLCINAPISVIIFSPF